MQRIAMIGLVFAVNTVVGCSAPTAPSDSAAEKTAPPTVRAVPVQKRPVYLTTAPIHLK